MSILIRNMEMPDSCFHCKLAEVCQHYKAEHYANKRHEDCPLEEVPETHDKRTETYACDCISRQAAIEAMKSISDSICEQQAIDALCELPSAQPEKVDTPTVDTPTCEDAVSRQAVYNVLDKMPIRGFKKDGETIHGLISLSQVNSAIINLPSAQPELIQCKDCTKRYVCRTSNIWAVAPKDDWFCADAERRIDESD